MDAALSVLLVTPRWTRDGGVATHAMTSAEALSRRGVDVRVLAARVHEGEPLAGITVHHSPELFDERATPAARVRDALDRPPDVIHLHQFEDPDVVAFMGSSAPVLVSVHGYSACTSGVYYFRPGEQCTRGHGPGCVPNLLLRGCAHARLPRGLPSAYRRAGRSLQTLRKADLALSYSSAVDRHLAANDVSPRRVIPLFTTVSPASGSGHADRRRVVFAGRVIAAKGVSVLLRAARELDAELVICGDGLGLPAARRLARRLGVHERVRFTGWLGPHELAQELAEASVVAMPGLWPEPFGLVGIEALAAGRPVVASDTGGVRDWLDDGVSGLCVKPGDPAALARALQELLADPARQQAMGEAGRERVAARFTAERHVAALLDAYAAARSSWEERQAASAGASSSTTAPALR
jgi:glycosyltransferase involved in cell wall biosynthesis